ncbi:MAG TPA: PAS domain-containing sensor histidine kinase [Prolixibacteraceae bacterium]|jgi:two-component system CheB/CheR fusion protein
MGTTQIDPKMENNEFFQTAEFFIQVIDSLQDYSIFTTDKELRINSWSAGSSKIFGYETDEVIGKHCEIIFTEEDKKNDVPQLKIETALKEGRVADSRWHVCKDGSLFYAYGVIFPIIGKSGELLGFVKILRDLTEKRKSEEAIQKYIKELQELNTHKDNILAILSHDLRSPLGTIVGIADYLKSDLDTMSLSEIRHMVEVLDKASTEELNMLDYLLEWARIKFATDIFSPAKIDLSKYINKVFDTLNEVAAQNSLTLHQKVEENTWVFADQKMVISILQNLVSNAIKHSRKGGEITISASENEAMILVRVKDTGIGMSKEKQEMLFNPQMKTLSKARVEDKGAGIGLLLSKGFVEKNGGKIWVESAEDEGSSFYFTLPINEPINQMESPGKNEFEESA